MLLCKVEGQKEECLLVQELRLKTFQRVDLFFVVTDALAHVRFLLRVACVKNTVNFLKSKPRVLLLHHLGMGNRFFVPNVRLFAYRK